MEEKRIINLRRWKEQRRASHAICFTTLAFGWAILVMACFLVRGPRLPTELYSAADQGKHLHDFFLSVSSSGVGNIREWSSIHREVQEEINWVRMRSSKEEHVELATPEKGASDQAENVSDAVEMEKEDENNEIALGEYTGGVKEDPDPAQLELGVDVSTKDSDKAEEPEGNNNATLRSKLVSDRVMPKSGGCAEVEEMGSAATGDTRSASLRLRRMIRSYFAEHGADRLRQLPANLFCERNFVLGNAQHDGFGNNIYKLLTAAGLGLILNRSLIIAEGGATIPAYVGKTRGGFRLPFGDYLSYSDQVFSMIEVKQLWVDHDCSGKYNRPLVLKRDDFDSPVHSTSLCEDWTKWTQPIFWFKGTQDTVALQFLLKNQHPSLRSAATMVLGDPSKPDSRPNTFGELMMAIVKPKEEVSQAVDWALDRRGDYQNGSRPEPPDVALHLRMRHSAKSSALEAATSCIGRILEDLPENAHRKPRIAVVSDTPSVVTFMKKKSSVAPSSEIISFDYEEFLSSNASELNSLREDAFLPPSKRRRDWGPLPRWVAVVDFYLAARATYAVVTGADQRVATTYAQLVASLAAAHSLEEAEEGEQLQQPARFYSSFQQGLLWQGLQSQGGWGHSWRPFGGRLSCPNQAPQCALTPLLPYAWWDAPLQSPIPRDRVKMRQWGIYVESDGEVTDRSVQSFCREKRNSTSEAVLLALPDATTS